MRISRDRTQGGGHDATGRGCTCARGPVLTGSLRAIGGMVARKIVGVGVLLIACSPGGADETSGATSTATATTAMSAASTSTTDAPAGSSSGEANVPTTGLVTSTGEATSTGGLESTSSGATSDPGESSDTGEASTSGAPLLRIEPAQAQVVVASGWSFPARFTAVLGDGEDTPVVAAWTVDDAALGRITRYGGTFAARNTAGGTVQVSAEYDGQIATADVEVVVVDDHPVCPPRPPLMEGEPAPGMFIKVVAPEYEGTGVYHGVYLPPDWTPERRYPVIVESPCNTFGQLFTGKVDDTRMGYHWAGCRDVVWIVMPYILNDANLNSGWGDTPATLAYWRTNVPRTLAAVGGDPGAVLVTGFSRGALGAGWIGLQDDEIADAWAGFYLHSHADAPGNGITPDGGANSPTRMMRVAGRSSLVSWGAVGDGGVTNSVNGADLLTSFGYPVQTFAVPGVGHTEAWMIDDAASRELVQSWLFATIAARPGTGAVYGRVTDMQGDGVPGVRVESGPLHWDVTDAEGYYGLRGLLMGTRAVTCTAPGCGAPIMVDVADTDVEDADFVAP